MVDKFIGKWQVTGTENMEEMLKAYGKSNYSTVLKTNSHNKLNSSAQSSE